jgi:hypothetical protein
VWLGETDDRNLKELLVPYPANQMRMWIGRYRRMSRDYEHPVQTSETLVDLIAIRLMLSRLTKS